MRSTDHNGSPRHHSRFTRWICVLIPFALTLVWACPAAAQMPTSVKHSLIRSENPKGSKARLVLPYVFSSETMGLVLGIGGAVKGYGQDQLLVAATAFAGSDDLEGKDDTVGVIAGMWDLRIPYTQRFFFDGHRVRRLLPPQAGVCRTGLCPRRNPAGQQ